MSARPAAPRPFHRPRTTVTRIASIGAGCAGLSLALSLALAPAAGAAEPAPEAPARAASVAVYRIAPDDELEVTVLNQPDLTRTVTILPDGTLSYPYVGEIDAAGLTIRELAQRLTAGLAAQLAHPQVTVRVVKQQEKQVSVLGAVRTPGKRSMKDGWCVLDVIADCGGLSVERPEWTSATLVRGSGAQAIPVDLSRLLSNGDAKENLPLAPGDVLLIQKVDPPDLQVRVLGEVTRPGSVPAPKDGSLLDVLAAAGGPTPKAALSRATILRGSSSIPVDLRALRAGTQVADAVKLVPGDTVVIPENKLEYAVFGAVRSPGMTGYPDDAPLTVLSALSRAGGQTEAAELKNASLIRPSRDGEPTVVAINLEAMMKKGDLSQDLPLQPGDILFLPTRKQGRVGPRDALGFVRDLLGFIPFVSVLSH